MHGSDERTGAPRVIVRRRMHADCHSGRMRRFVVRAVVNAIALWLATLLFAAFGHGDGVRVVPYRAEDPVASVLTFLLLGLIFGLVNGVLGTAIRIVAFPLYLLTLGLISLVVNGLLFLLVAWISGAIGFGLVVDGFWWGVLGALVTGIIGWVVGLLLRPLSGRDPD
jgi:putative membrane protein